MLKSSKFCGRHHELINSFGISVSKMTRAGLKPIGPVAPDRAPRWSYLLSAAQVHNNTLQGLHR